MQMQKKRKWFVLGIVALVMALAATFQNRGEAQQLGMGDVAVRNETNHTVYATMYRNGQIVRAVSVSAFSTDYWRGVPVGPCEVLFEAVGYGKVLKRFVVAPGSRAQNTEGLISVDNMTRNDQLWGAGPSLLVLQARIANLEADNRAIKARIVALEARR